MEQKIYEIVDANTKKTIDRISWEKLSEQNKEWGYSGGVALRSDYRRTKRRNEGGKITYVANPDDRGDLDDEQGDLIEYKESYQILQDGTQVSDRLIEICEEELKSPKSILKAHKFDVNLWDVVSVRNNLYHQQKKGGERLLLYQSRLTVKPKVEPELNEERIDNIFKKLSVNEFSIPAFITLKNNKETNGKCLVVPIADFHLGLYAKQEISGDNYDLAIAEKLFHKTIGEVANRLQGQKFEEVVFVIGNDFLNTDNLTNTTTKGTPQDSAAFWYEIVDKAVELIISGITILSQFGKVKIYNVVSNHDNQSMYAIMKTIQAVYRNNEDVEVDTSALPRKYHCFGKTLMGLTHDMNVKKGLELMTTEAKSQWAACDKFYWFLAHLHTAMQYEKQGLLEIYRLPTFSGTSRWSKNSGFVSVDKRTQCFIVDAENGITDIMNIYV
jgi:hypothetical protein